MSKLNRTDTAPDFISEDILGNVINLDDFKNDKILLSFFRGAACPFCNLRVNQLINHYQKFQEQEINIIIVFAASKEEILKYAGKQKSPFPIIADPKLELYKKYGIEESSIGMIKAMMNPFKMMKIMFSGFFNMKSIKDRPIIPADFLIDQDKIIYTAYYGKDFGDHIPIQEVLAWNN